MEDCLFCRIARKEEPASIVYEDDETMAFMDINQGVRGHLLVIPKAHYVNLLDIDPKAAEAVARTVVKLAPALKEAMGADGINLWQATGWEAGQRVFHFHVHMIPRHSGDGLPFGKFARLSREEMDRMAEMIGNRVKEGLRKA
jgi:histidine triad (HIT) family protein